MKRVKEIEFEALVRCVPADLIRDALKEAERDSKRRRKLPSELVIWLVVGMGLFRRENIETCLIKVARVLGSRWGPAECPHSTSVAKARDRVGFDVMRTIFRKLAALLFEQHRSLSKWHGFDVLTMDGSTFRAPDSPENGEAFGRPGTSRGRGRSAFPQLRVVMLVSAFTHLIVKVAMGPYHDNELKIAAHLVKEIPPNALLLLDRAFHCLVWPCRLLEHGSHFVIKAKKGKSVIATKKTKCLGRGDWLAYLVSTENTRRENPGLPERLQVRLITRKRKGFPSFTVVTSLLCPEAHSADDVFDLYGERWEAELSYRELKTHLHEEWTFRSRTPNRVLQEAYGLFMAYNCTRALMCEAASDAGVKPLELSFLDCLRQIRSSIEDKALFLDQDALLSALGRCRLQPKRIGRSCPRAVKLKSSKFPAKRAGKIPVRTRYQAQRARYAARRQSAVS